MFKKRKKKNTQRRKGKNDTSKETQHLQENYCRIIKFAIRL